MRTSPIQDSFQSGFIGRRVRGRTGVDAYKNGLALAENWHPLVQGPIRLRQGSKFIEAVDANNWVSGQAGVLGLRTFTFQRGIDEDAIIEIGDTDIIVRDSNTGQQIIGGVSGNLLPDPTFVNNGIGIGNWDSSEWQGTPDLIFNTDPGRSKTGGTDNFIVKPVLEKCQLHMNTDGSPNGANGTALTQRTAFPINLPAGSELLLNELSFKLYFFSNVPGTDPLLPEPLADPKIRVNVGTTQGAADVFTTDVVIALMSTEQDVVLSFVPGGGNTTLFCSFEFIWTGTTAVVPELLTGFFDGGKGLSVNLSELAYVAPLAGGSGSVVEFSSLWTAEQMECLQYCIDPGEQVAYFTHPEVETQRLRLLNGEWTFEALSAITLPSVFIPPSPNLWAAGNFPVSCAIHEGRLWLGGSPLNPATLWASRSGNYQDFNNAAPASQDDPLLFPLSSSGNIQTLTSRKELVVLTDISEVIGTSQQGIIAFDDFSFPKQTDWGSNCVQPMVIGRSMVYTSNSRKRMRTFADEGGTNFGWDGNELSLLAQDLFGSPVRRMVYLDEPAYQACFLLADGTMAMATYFYPENVIGWWKFITSHNGDRDYGDQNSPAGASDNGTQLQNQVMDIAKVNTSAGAKLWMIVNRVGFAGTLKPGHELLAFDDLSGPPVALDSWAERVPYDVFVDGTMRFDDVDELTDQSVNVVIKHVDVSTMAETFTVHPNVTVFAGVSTPLESWVQAGDIAYVGLFYDNEFELLPREGVSNRGTSMTSKRRWNKVFVRLSNSAVPLVNGEAPRDRTPGSPMGTAEPFFVGDVEYTELGSNDQGQLNIKQDKPLQTEILALFGKVTSTEV